MIPNDASRQDGSSWKVTVRWLAWTPGWQRRDLKDWALDAAVPTYAAGCLVETGQA